MLQSSVFAFCIRVQEYMYMKNKIVVEKLHFYTTILCVDENIA